MLRSHSNTRDDDSKLHRPRRPLADLERVSLCFWVEGVVMRGRDLTYAEFRLFNHLIYQCYIVAIEEGESDGLIPVRANAREIGQALGLDRAEVYRAMNSLVSQGYACRSSKGIFPNKAKFLQLAQGAARKILFRVAEELPEPRDGDGESPSERRGIPDVGDGESPSGAIKERAGAPASENSDSGEEREEKTRKYIYHEDSIVQPGTDAIAPAGAHAHTRRPMPTAEEEAELVEWCARHLGSPGIGKALLQGARGLYPWDWTWKALRRAKLRNVANAAYMMRILEGWEVVGNCDAGPEDRYDRELVPLAVVPMTAVAPLAVVPGRPLSNSQRVVAENVMARESIAKGICPFTGKPFEDDDEADGTTRVDQGS